MSRLLFAKKPLTARWPLTMRVQARTMTLDKSASVPVKSGEWLLELPPREPWPGQLEYLYRRSDGAVVAFDSPLTEEQACEIRERKPIAAMSAIAEVDEQVESQFGLTIERISKDSPFNLIRCPLCGGHDFITVEMAGVWCFGCNAQFSVRSTAGDPGFVVDCHFDHVDWYSARYLLPHTRKLHLYMVYKSGQGSPLDLTHDRCKWRSPACTKKDVKLTSGHPSLRDGLHACMIGEVYDWQFGGAVPSKPRQWSYSFLMHEGKHWPDRLYRPDPVSEDESSMLQEAARLMKIHNHNVTAMKLEQMAVRKEAILLSGWGRMWPALNRLQEGERYLLADWVYHLTGKEEDRVGQVLVAHPVWQVVTLEKGQVMKTVRKNICPSCQEPVDPAVLQEAARRYLAGHKLEDWSLWRRTNGHTGCANVWGGWSMFQDLLVATQEEAYEQPA